MVKYTDKEQKKFFMNRTNCGRKYKVWQRALPTQKKEQ